MSRMHEEWTLSSDNERAVTRGQAETGRVVTAAALIMILVFGVVHARGPARLRRDRARLRPQRYSSTRSSSAPSWCPAAMHVMGRANWWLPGWLDRALPHLHVEAADLLEAEAGDRAFGGLRTELSELGR